jgi:hypothetical protein
VKWLRIELRRERQDLRAGHVVAGQLELLFRLEIFEIEHRHRHRFLLEAALSKLQRNRASTGAQERVSGYA